MEDEDFKWFVGLGMALILAVMIVPIIFDVLKQNTGGTQGNSTYPLAFPWDQYIGGISVTNPFFILPLIGIAIAFIYFCLKDIIPLVSGDEDVSLPEHHSSFPDHPEPCSEQEYEAVVEEPQIFSNLKCPKCGGVLRFKRYMLKTTCEYCGSVVRRIEKDDEEQERDG